MHDSVVDGLCTHGHELIYIMEDRIRIVDVRKPVSEGNVIQDMPIGAGHSEEIEQATPYLHTMLSGSHAVVWSFSYMDLLVWDRNNGQCVRVFSDTDSGCPILKR